MEFGSDLDEWKGGRMKEKHCWLQIAGVYITRLGYVKILTWGSSIGCLGWGHST